MLSNLSIKKGQMPFFYVLLNVELIDFLFYFSISILFIFHLGIKKPP